MNKILGSLFGLFLLFMFAGNASAAPMTWTETLDWNPNKYLFSDFAYTHDIKNDGFIGYLQGGDDLVLTYTLSIALYDDNDNRREKVVIDQPGWTADRRYNFNLEVQELGWSVFGVVSLNIDGTIDINLNNIKGDYYLDYSTIVASGDDGYESCTPVPEPTTGILFGIGILGLAAISRRKK